MPAPYNGKSQEQITIAQHILYIASKAFNLIEQGDLPLEHTQAYARQYAVKLDVHPNLRDFVARQAYVQVEIWRIKGYQHSA
jgi:hypothetical protein